jgi:hypothetical protein
MSTIDRMKIMRLKIIEIENYIYIYIIYYIFLVINIINLKNNFPQDFGSNL